VSDELAQSDSASVVESPREQRFESLLASPTISVDSLRGLSWKGIPPQYRPKVWKLLIGYLPNVLDRHAGIIERKHAEYREIVEQHFGPDSRRDEAIMHQIAIDVPRTAPNLALFRNAIVREALARILYCWSIRRPASGYVQGINDLVTPFYDVFLSEYISAIGSPSTTVSLPENALFKIEADSFWCLSKLLDSIQDNYTFNQTGISRQISRMKDILTRTDPKLLIHLDKQGVSLLQFAFRWVNCLLMREFPLHMIIRMWDTYLSEDENGFSEFHTYVCAAFLSKWSGELQRLEFQDIILFLQNPPTDTWSLTDLEVLLSEAFVWKSLFHGSSGHFQKT
jgi:hypothetical protein